MNGFPYNTPARRVIAAERAYNHAVGVLLFYPPLTLDYRVSITSVKEFRKRLRDAYIEQSREQAQVFPEEYGQTRP